MDPITDGNPITWTVGILEACPTRWTFGTLSLEACLRAESGVLEGAGGDIANLIGDGDQSVQAAPHDRSVQSLMQG